MASSELFPTVAYITFNTKSFKRIFLELQINKPSDGNDCESSAYKNTHIHTKNNFNPSIPDSFTSNFKTSSVFLKDHAKYLKLSYFSRSSYFSMVLFLSYKCLFQLFRDADDVYLTDRRQIRKHQQIEPSGHSVSKTKPTCHSQV